MAAMSRTETAQLPNIRWNAAALQSWQRVNYEREQVGDEPNLFRFTIQTLELPTASSRWALKWAGHPEVTFDDIRSDKLPEVTEQEKSQRREAVKLAKEIREELDIRPLTVPALIRSLRER